MYCQDTAPTRLHGLKGVTGPHLPPPLELTEDPLEALVHVVELRGHRAREHTQDRMTQLPLDVDNKSPQSLCFFQVKVK